MSTCRDEAVTAAAQQELERVAIIVATASCMASRVDSVADDGDRHAGNREMAMLLATGELAP